MEEILIKAGQLFLSLAILITLHELGHFVAARIFGTRVEKFYLFFNPWFSIAKKKIGDTEYGLGWLPLGGYVKIAGMIDESMDKEQLKQPAQPWEFRAKPAWQRLIIMLGGIIVNLILGWFIYSMLLFSVGESYIPAKSAAYGIMATDSTALKIGLRNGDKIVSVGGEPIEKHQDVPIKILLNDDRTIEVDRNGERVSIPVSDSHVKGIIASQTGGFITERFPFVIAGFGDASVAEKSGLKKDDQVIAVNGEPTFFFDEVRDALTRNKGDTIRVTALRGTDTVHQAVALGNDGLLGVFTKTSPDYFPVAVKEYTLAQSFPAGYHKAKKTLTDYIRQFKLIFNRDIEGYKHLGGFISIGKAFSPQWDWVNFWSFTAFLSIALAFMNLLPIPALDGGHVVFTLYEMVTRRKPNEKFLEYAQIAGMVILLSLMAYANGNDIVKLFR